MSILIAPYHEGMRLGQGFNSYTHELCIDQAVYIQSKDTETTSPSQVVSYSSRLVEKLSDVVDTMNVSYSATIKKGTVGISGNSAAFDETMFRSADLNAIVSVKVVNQTTTVSENCKFRPLRGYVPGNPRFNEVYGDCYISGFLEGGDFTGIVSIKVLNGADTEKVKNEIKGNLGAPAKEEFSLDPFGSNRSGSMSVLKDTECTVSVNWTGGGQIKDAGTQWDMDSMFSAAAAFPSKVADCPQKTWAILTKYKSNRSFVAHYKESIYKSLDYDQISGYTAELFDSFMDYKSLLKTLQHVINNRDAYVVKNAGAKRSTIDLSMTTLLGVRHAMRDEQAKIVEAIRVLSCDPGILRRQARLCSGRYKNSVVQSIVDQALAGFNIAPKNKSTESLQEVSSPPVLIQERSSDEDEDETFLEENFDFDNLIPAEIWEDLMPQPKPSHALNSSTGNPTNSIELQAPTKHTIPASIPNDQIYTDPIIAQLRNELNGAKTEAQKLSSDLALKAEQLAQAESSCHDHLNLKIKAEENAKITEKALKDTRDALKLEKDALEKKLNQEVQEKQKEKDTLEKKLVQEVQEKEKEKDALEKRLNQEKEKEKDASEKKLNSMLQERAKEKADLEKRLNLEVLEKQKEQETKKALNTSLEALKSDVTTANQKLEKIESSNQSLRKDKAALESRLVPFYTKDRISFAFVLWGGHRMDGKDEFKPGIDKLFEYAHNKALFYSGREFFNNWLPSHGPELIVAYRYDDKGPLQTLACLYGSSCQFAPYP